MIRKSSWRILFLIILTTVLASGILIRLFSLQVVKSNFYNILAQNQHQIFQKLVPQRGEIFIQDGKENYFRVATNRPYQMLYLVPREIPESQKEEIVQKLAQVLNQDKEEIKSKINKKDDPYEIVAHKLSDDLVKTIKDLNLKGVYFTPETWRFYPASTLLSHLLGFVGYFDNQRVGQYGLEGYYQKQLEGQPGFIETVKDAIGRWILSGDYRLEEARDGDDLILTIDRNIQFTTEENLKEVVEKWKAEAGNVIIMEPKSGKILALANWPNFDPNNYSEVENINIFLNSATQKLFEPGSVFKPVTMAAGLDTDKIGPQTTYTDGGIVRIGGYTITNANNRSYGLSSMTKVLEKSINTGAVFVQRLIGPDVFREYVNKFGFSQVTGIDLESEIAGNINNLKEDSPEINFATASFGQGIAVTPIELITALSAIANEGKLMKPYIVEKIIHPDGTETSIEPEIIKQVISPQTASKLTSMLVSTVRTGYDKIKIKGYFIAGKTGTAQIPNPDRKGYGDESIHTFVGWAPAFNPKFIILLKIDKPKGIRFASDSLAPTFAKLTQYLLNYYEIPPEE